MAADGIVYVMDSDAVVSAFDMARGARVWRFDTKEKDDDSTNVGGGLALDQGTLYAVNGLAELVALDHHQFRSLFSGSPIKRIGRNRFIRNVLIAIGNSDDPSLRPAAEALRLDPDPVVAEAAEWASDQLAQPSSCICSARA